MLMNQDKGIRTTGLSYHKSTDFIIFDVYGSFNLVFSTYLIYFIVIFSVH
jgi:hypothetical protein